MTERGVENSIIVLPKQSFTTSKLEASIWDELGNVIVILYRSISAQKTDFGFGPANLANR